MNQQAVFAQLLLQTQQALLITGFEEFMHESRCGDDADSQALLAGRQTKAETNVRLAGAAVSHCDVVLIAGDLITAGQLHHQHLMQRGHGLEVKAVEAFECRELCGFDPPFHRAAFPVDQFQFGEAQPRSIDKCLLPRIVWRLCHTRAGKSADAEPLGGGSVTVGACRS